MILFPDPISSKFVETEGERAGYLTDEARYFLDELIAALREQHPQTGNQYI